MLEILWYLRWLLRSEIVKEFCDPGLAKLVTIDEAVSARAVVRHKILNLCLQFTQSFAKFYVWP